MKIGEQLDEPHRDAEHHQEQVVGIVAGNVEQAKRKSDERTYCGSGVAHLACMLPSSFRTSMREALYPHDKKGMGKHDYSYCNV